MPELPEVQTTAHILNKVTKGLRISDVWTDYGSAFHTGKDNIKDRNYFAFFKRQVVGRKITGVTRRAKNVLIGLSGSKTILVHMKMTGHLLYGNYTFASGGWLPPKGGPLADPFNRFIHLAFIFSNKKVLVLSDMRKFAKVTLFDTDKIDTMDDLKKLGPEPLEKDFSYAVFKKQLQKRPNGKIKTVLMDQEIIAGIGNIYSDEVLWLSGVHPLTRVKNITELKLKSLYKNINIILKHSIRVGGDSMSDYRNPYGLRGGYQNIHKAYRQTGKYCQRKAVLEL